MIIYITGSTGFIGKNLTEELIKKKYNLVKISRRKEKIKKKENIKLINLDLYSEDYNKNINNFLKKIKFKKNDILIHLAWKSLNDFSNDDHLNKIFFKDIFFLKKVIDHGLNRVIVSGTCLEYGLREGKLKETHKVNPIVSYAISKNLVRKFLQSYVKIKNFNYQWLRIFYIKDPDKIKNNLFYQLNDSIRNKAKSFNMSHGNQLRDFINLSEISRLIIQCIKKPKVRGIINCCSGNPIKVKKLISEEIKKKKSNLKLNFGYYKVPRYEPMNFWGDTQKMKKLLK